MRLCKACVCSSTMDRNTSSERVTAFLPATDMWEITVLLQLTYLLYSFSSGPGCLLVFRERTRPFSSCWTACSLMECQCPRRARALMERSSRRALPPRQAGEHRGTVTQRGWRSTHTHEQPTREGEEPLCCNHSALYRQTLLTSR